MENSFLILQFLLSPAHDPEESHPETHDIEIIGYAADIAWKRVWASLRLFYHVVKGTVPIIIWMVEKIRMLGLVITDIPWISHLMSDLSKDCFGKDFGGRKTSLCYHFAANRGKLLDDLFGLVRLYALCCYAGGVKECEEGGGVFRVVGKDVYGGAIWETCFEILSSTSMVWKREEAFALTLQKNPQIPMVKLLDVLMFWFW
jgi:hypothetical protein